MGGIRGLEVIRFHGRYYVRYHRYDGYWDGLGARIIAKIPTDPQEYKEWLESTRAWWSDKEALLERHVYETQDGVEPDSAYFDEFEELPSEMPRLSVYGPMFCYILNLDHQVLTVDYTMHWKLNKIPRENDAWIEAIVRTDVRKLNTIAATAEQTASLALELPQGDRPIVYNHCCVAASQDISMPSKAFLTNVMARSLVTYRHEIISFGREWSPESFPFREVAFALVSIASGQAKFCAFPGNRCHPLNCKLWRCPEWHFDVTNVWVHKDWAGDDGPVLEFASPVHRPGEPPGASPAETMYWHEKVLVSLVLSIDGESISKAVEFGIQQGRTNFQIAFLTLFCVKLAEVSLDGDGKPFLKHCSSLPLSPLRQSHCLSTHPLDRTKLQPGMKSRRPSWQSIMDSNCTATSESLQKYFPGLAALVNFFHVAANRQATSSGGVNLPPELHEHILSYVDYDTWKACSVVSTTFRSCCLRKYRINDRMMIAAVPTARRINLHRELIPTLSFEFEDMDTGERFLMMIHESSWNLVQKHNWRPIIGGQRKVLMLDVDVEYKEVEEEPKEMVKSAQVQGQHHIHD
ncbi:hypothetical protein XA68_15441 [Ophiocordyceps unilateralis]|uniref:F-box domain-containing protein n=1 Tax=Ophiocordyceps unilateralis TaxID=268505 RepID=A0A2A9P8B9_OPHUN|nr:hypothetical protein XA68_15441 [Ophiocordyceps unilateralis]